MKTAQRRLAAVAGLIFTIWNAISLVQAVESGDEDVVTLTAVAGSLGLLITIALVWRDVFGLLSRWHARPAGPVRRAIRGGIRALFSRWALLSMGIAALIAIGSLAGLRAVRRSSAADWVADLTVLHLMDVGENTRTLALDHDTRRLFTGSSTYGIAAIDVSDPAHPAITSQRQPFERSDPVAVEVVGDYVYVADRANGVTVFDTRTPWAIDLATHSRLAGSDGIAVAGSLAYFISGPRLTIMDTTNPRAPSEIAHHRLWSHYDGIAVHEGRAYLWSSGGLQIVDISDYREILPLGTYPGSISAVRIVGSHVYLTETDNGLMVLDVSDPTEPRLVARRRIRPGDARGIAVVDDYAIVTHHRGMTIFDVSSPEAPRRIRQVRIDSSQVFDAGAVAAHDGQVFVTGEDGGVALLGPAASTGGTADDSRGVTAGTEQPDAPQMPGVMTIQPTDTTFEAIGHWDAAEWPSYASLHGDTIVVQKENGLAILQAGDGGTLSERAFVPLWAQSAFAPLEDDIYGILSNATHAYALHRDGSVSVVEVANPAAARFVTRSSSLARPILRQLRVTELDISGNHLYAASDGIGVIDVANPARPGVLALHTDFVPFTDIATFGTYVYAVLEEAGTVAVFDTSDPRVLGHQAIVGHIESATDIVVDRSYAYVATEDGHIAVLELDDPRYPRLVARIPTGRRIVHIAAAGGYLAVSAEDSGFTLYDIRDPEHGVSMLAHSAAMTTSNRFLGPYRLFVGRRALYAVDATGITAYTLPVLETETRATPRVATLIEPAGAGRVVVDSPGAARAGDTVVLRAIPAAGYLFDRWIVDDLRYGSTSEQIEIAVTTNTQATARFVRAGRLVRVSHTPIDEVDLFDVAIDGTTAYLATGGERLFVYDVANPASPRFLSRWTLPDAVDIELTGSRAYVARWRDGIDVLDVSDPMALNRIDQTSGFFRDIAIHGPLLAAAGRDRLMLYDRSGDELRYLGEVVTGGDTTDVSLTANAAFLSSSRTLMMVDISDAGAPYVTATFTANALMNSVAISGDYAYVANAFDGIHVFNIGEPTLAHRVATYDTALAWDIELVDTYAFVADGPNGVVVLDVSMPTDPRIVARHPAAGFAIGVTVHRDLIYVAHRDAGMTVLRFVPPTE